MHRWLRYLRIAFSATCLIACVLLIALWVRSYRHTDLLSGSVGGRGFVIIESQEGRLIYIRDLKAPGLRSWSISTDIYGWMESLAIQGRSWGWDSSGNPHFGFLPHWLPVLLSITLATVPWLRDLKCRFSLRTLLIATTLFAVGLGFIMWSMC